MCEADHQFCPWMGEKFQQNWNWTQSMLAQTGNTSDYWNMVRYVTEHGTSHRACWHRLATPVTIGPWSGMLQNMEL